MLVLSGLGPHDEVARHAPLSERQTPDCQGEGVGGWRSTGFACQPKVGAAIREIRRAVGGGTSDG
jgi:hypothetical protein